MSTPTIPTNYTTRQLVWDIGGIDGSKLWMDAADYTISIVKKHNSELILLHVIPP